MPNKFYNKQVTYSLSGRSSKAMRAKGQALGTTMSPHKDPWPKVGGPTKKWPERSGYRVAEEHPLAD